MQSSGFGDRAVPSQEAPLRIRPLRRRLSSLCTTTNTFPRSCAERAAVSTVSRSAPAAAARAAASVEKPPPLGHERVVTTPTTEPNSRAVCAAELYVLDSAAER